ncbi:isoprenyl transferase [Prochlorococcus marinus str. MU1402]|uniref:isoprenyl transferase n=1 Tax=Prochlorococcus marinus TaxID=1219 RepID=UPI001ADB715D|nr:isoprenyl transferase [Prochlorococcus marinus]MBO8232188.1 isoprenyl transferase [Prochlorococcus marinus XMU1402]MBW3056924.1 isoprenyl transferase [Prochlorococcus marinus str. MU1402]
MRLGKLIDDKINDLLIKIDMQKVPNHVAIIMDGNGRWATGKGLPRSFGHKQGVIVLKEILKAAKNLGCKIITVYAFSTENWTRPTKEVEFLINLFSEVLKNEIKEIHEESTKIKFIGDLTPFPKNLKEIISSSESLTKNNNKFLFNVCVNYGGRQEIVKVAKQLALKSSSGEIKPNEIDEKLFDSELLTGGIKDPELLIRTSGEKRISNFLLWQLAYSEIYISDVLWPDFNEYEFLKAIIDYQSRNRRFGGIESLPNESLKDSQCSS